jgi:hypothetical protein
MTITQISRDIIEWGETVSILAMQDGKRVRFQFPDRAAAFKAHRKMLKAGVDYLPTSEETKRTRWLSAPVIR